MVDGIRIDDLPPDLTGADPEYEFPAILAGVTKKLSVDQVKVLIMAAILDSAPATLDTLNELAAALGDDPNFAATITAALGLKLNSSSYTAADVLAKLLTVDGAASALDADLLDGQHGAYYRDASNINAGSLAIARMGASTFIKTLLDDVDAATARATLAAMGATETWQVGAVTTLGAVSGFNIAFPANARKIRIHVAKLKPVLTNENARLRVTEDGTTYLNSGYFADQARSVGGAATVTQASPATATSDIVLTSAVGISGTRQCALTVDFNFPSDVSACDMTYVATGMDDTPAPWMTSGGGRRSTAAALQGCRIFFNNGQAAGAKWWMEWMI